MIWLQLTANTGPAECCLAVVKALKVLEREAASARVGLAVIEQVPGPRAGTLLSVLLQLEGDGAEALAARWCGTVLWTCRSPYRPTHGRKNWFLSGTAFHPAPIPPPGEIRYETTRSSGPGGQHVNTSDTAVRATHVGTGLSVKVQTERSQHINKVLAGQLLASKLAALERDRREGEKATRWLHHHRAERGNASRVFVGPEFVEKL